MEIGKVLGPHWQSHTEMSLRGQTREVQGDGVFHWQRALNNESSW